VQTRPNATFNMKRLFLPKNNHWLKRTILIFSFILFDYVSTLAFCQTPYDEANIYARAFMTSLGILPGLTLFVLIANLPVYMVLSVDSHTIRLPPKIAVFIEVAVDAFFAWFVGGLHFSGGSSWYWTASDLPRQALGALLYMVIAVPFVKPHRPRYDN